MAPRMVQTRPLIRAGPSVPILVRTRGPVRIRALMARISTGGIRTALMVRMPKAHTESRVLQSPHRRPAGGQVLPVKRQRRFIAQGPSGRNTSAQGQIGERLIVVRRMIFMQHSILARIIADC